MASKRETDIHIIDKKYEIYQKCKAFLCNGIRKEKI